MINRRGQGSEEECHTWTAPGEDKEGREERLAAGEEMVASNLCEAAKHGRVDELRKVLSQCSTAEVNAGEPKHGYRPLHYGTKPVPGQDAYMFRPFRDRVPTLCWGDVDLFFEQLLGTV